MKIESKLWIINIKLLKNKIDNEIEILKKSDDKLNYISTNEELRRDIERCGKDFFKEYSYKENNKLHNRALAINGKHLICHISVIDCIIKG